MIEVKNLQKAFGGNMVLKGVTETIEKGEKIAILGPSGSGKSTFLRCLNRLEEPTGGEIWFEGKDITAKDCDINRIRRKMGMVFQHFNLFPHLTVKQNITLAPVNLKLQTRMKKPCVCWSVSAWRTKRTPIQTSFPAGRSSASPSYARWPWSRK